MISGSRFFQSLNLIGLIVLAGCETTPQAGRIAELKPAFEQLPRIEQKKVARGAIDQGYTMQMIYMALGRPDQITAAPDGNAVQWSYRQLYPTEGMNQGPLYRAHPNALSGGAAGRAWSGFKGHGEAGMPRPHAVADAPSGPDLPPIDLDVSFRDGKVTFIKVNPDKA